MNFKSDNVYGVCAEIIQALNKANEGTECSYSADIYTQELQRQLSRVFEKEVTVFLTTTGTAANALSLAALVKPYQVIYGYKDAHIQTDECAAYSLFTGGAALQLVDGKEGKIDPVLLTTAIETTKSLRPHAQEPGCVSITQATEHGTVYSLQELRTITTIAQSYGLPVHMDGARFTNALVSLGCSPAEMTWKSGIDVLSFGATKNGAMMAEAVIFFNQEYVHGFEYLHKRAGQLVSKSRFISVQFLAYLDNDLWLKNARHANAMAQNLSQVFMKHGVELAYPVQANELFVILSPSVVQFLRQEGAQFYEWGAPGSNLYRFVTCCFTRESSISSFDVLLEKAIFLSR